MKYKKIMLKEINQYVRDITSLGSLPFTILTIIIFLFIDYKSALIILIGLILIHIIGSFIKIIFYKKRPNKQTYSNILEKIDSGSFPSVHSARALLIALILYPFFSNLVLGIIIALVILVGYSRIHLKKHYIIDVIGGYILGLISWYIANILVQYL